MEHTTGTAPESMVFRGERYTFGLRRRALTGTAAIAALLGGWVMPAVAGEWEVIPSLEIVETYTDNVELVSEQQQKTDDFITRINPGISINGQGARARLSLTYAPNFLIFAESDEDTDLRHYLAARGNVELSEDLFFVDASASINQQFLDRGGSISSNQDNVNDNRRTVQTYSISPYLQQNFGTVATGELRYRASYTETVESEDNIDFADVLQDTLSHRVSARLNSGPQFTRFSWGAELLYFKSDRKRFNGDSNTYTARLTGQYVVNRVVSLVGSVGYEKIDDASFGRRPDGFIWDVGAILTPGPRTRFELRGGERYGDTNWRSSLTYELSKRTRFTASYLEEITTTQNVLLGELINNPDIDAVDPGGFSLIDNGFKRKRVSGGLNGERGQASFSLTGFWERRVPDFGVRSERNYGGNGNLAYRFSRVLSSRISGSYQKTKFLDGPQREDDFYSATGGLTYQISQSISGGLTYIFTYRDSNFADREIKENAVKVNLRATF